MKLIRTSLLTVFVLLNLQAFTQNSYDQEWHFGDGTSVDFGTGNPILGSSSVATPTTTEPASVCSNTGVLMAYTDGDTLFNADGEAVINGGFADHAIENIFSPIPGSPNRFYLFRSNTTFGVSWSIVDLSAGGGQGEIIETEKQQVFHPHFSQLMVTSHADMFNFWLVVADNNSGTGNLLQLTSFTVTTAGLDEISSFSENYSWATFFETLEEARMSPSCDRIATSHKGHYITIFQFDNSTGIASTGFETAANSPDSFGALNYIDFSPSGDYLYVLRDFDEVVRFDATLLDPSTFLASEEDLGFGLVDFTHIKRGPQGYMYLMDNQNQQLAAVEDPDSDTPVLIDSVLAFSSNVRFFPNTVNSCQAFSAIQVNDVCIGDSTYFFSNIGAMADSIYWTINGDMVNDTVYDLLTFVEFYPNPGDYDVTFNYLFDTLWTALNDIATVYAQPTVDLGPDQQACEGEVIQLSTGETPYDITWSSGQNTPTIEVTEGGLYGVSIVNGLCSVYDEVEASFIPFPNTGLSDIVICDTIYPITLDATAPFVDSYLWDDGTPLPELIVDSTGTYTVTVSNSCFTVQDEATVTYVLFPDELLEESYSVCAFDTLFLSSAYPFGNIDWSNGDSGASALITGEGFFTIDINHLGCMTSDEFYVERIEYVDASQLIMPNVCTFNKDGLNENFRPFIPYNPELDICTYQTLDVDQKVYNRWGVLLSETKCGWLGESPNGNLVTEGTYYYIVDIYSKCLQYESEKRIVNHFQVFE